MGIFERQSDFVLSAYQASGNVCLSLSSGEQKLARQNLVLQLLCEIPSSSHFLVSPLPSGVLQVQLVRLRDNGSEVSDFERSVVLWELLQDKDALSVRMFPGSGGEEQISR